MIWNLDPTHAVVEFSVKHMGLATVKGSFKSFTATGETNDAGVPTSLSMEIDAASIFTNDDLRDAHLKSADFFEIEKFPELTFRSTSITGSGDELLIVGDLTIRGVTNQVTLKGELSKTVTDPWGNQRTSIAATGTLSRETFGLVWNMALEFGGFMVSDQVKLLIEAEAVAAVEATAGAR